MATTAGEDGHEEVDDAVLVGVEVGVVDLRVGDHGGVVDQLARRPAAGVDLLECPDAGDGADQCGAVRVGAVVAGVAREVVDAVGDAGRVRGRALGLDGGVLEGGAAAGLTRLGVGEVEARGVVEAHIVEAGRPDVGVRVELAQGHLLEQVEGRARLLRVVDDRLELLTGVGGLVVAVGVLHRDHRERAVAVLRGLVGLARGDHLRPVADDRGTRVGGVEHRLRGQVAPDDRGLLGGAGRLALEDQGRVGSGGDVTGGPQDLVGSHRVVARAARVEEGGARGAP